MAFTDTEFEINGVSFRARKMNAVAGYRLLMKIIREAGKSLRSAEFAPLDREQDMLLATASVIATMPEDVVTEIETAMFGCIQFRQSNGEWAKVDANLGMAISDPMDALELLIRGLGVNFGASNLTARLTALVGSVMAGEPDQTS